MVPSEGVESSGEVVIQSACVFGATGLLGSALCRNLRADGIRAVSYSRSAKPSTGSPARDESAYWDPSRGELDREPLVGADAVINLAGDNLASGRWNEARKRELWQSRVGATAFLCRELASLDQKPKVLVSASAVGYYGDRGDDAVYEDSAPGKGFLAELCQAWEAATEPARAAGVRVVLLRFGVVLTPDGGALAKMLPAFRVGVGGKLGSGEQRMPWIALVDAVSVIRFALAHAELSGPINAVAPESISNAQLTRTLGRVLGRPVVLPVPAFMLKAAMGEMARELLLTGANVRPRRLETAGYRFEYPRLDDALESILPRRLSQTSS